MIYRRLGKTGLNVSVIGIGTYQFSGEWGQTFKEKEVNSILLKGKELGVNLIDTAASYGDHLSEELIGKTIQRNRLHWIIATKFGNCFSQAQRNISTNFSLHNVRIQLERSLKALRTDYIDLYQFHSGTNEDYDNDQLWSFLNQQVQYGKIRSLGLSISNNLVTSGDLYQVKKAKQLGITSIQVVYNRLVQKAEETILPYCRSEEIGILARVPLAKGILSGKFNPDHTFKKSDPRGQFDVDYNAKFLRQVQKIKKEEIPDKIDMAQWALCWCLKNSAVTCVIPGCKNINQVKLNASAVNLIKQ